MTGEPAYQQPPMYATDPNYGHPQASIGFDHNAGMYGGYGMPSHQVCLVSHGWAWSGERVVLTIRRRCTRTHRRRRPSRMATGSMARARARQTPRESGTLRAIESGSCCLGSGYWRCFGGPGCVYRLHPLTTHDEAAFIIAGSITRWPGRVVWWGRGAHLWSLDLNFLFDFVCRWMFFLIFSSTTSRYTTPFLTLIP